MARRLFASFMIQQLFYVLAEITVDVSLGTEINALE